MGGTGRRLKISFPDSGESVTAEMLEAEAPAVCAFIWDRLPVDAKALHGMYSGAEVFAIIEDPAPAKPENLVYLPLPGEILYFFDEGRGAAGARKPVGEICIVYGRGVMLRGHEGVPVQASLFARIPGDWKHDWIEFANACRRCRWEGPQPILIERSGE
jgi:hypothetical protein